MVSSSTHLFLVLFSSHLLLSAANDTIQQGESLRDDANGNLTSGSFILHFFSPASTTRTTKRYLAVSYTSKNFSRAVWIANRDNPISDRTGILNISAQGGLSLYQESTSELKWSALTANSSELSVELQLLDTGMLVLKAPGSGRSIWESFNYPTDTMLPTMKLGEERFLTSWRTESDPSSGEFTYRMRCHQDRSCEMYITAKNRSIIYRAGPWDATQNRFSGNPNLLRHSDDINFQFSNSNGVQYYSFQILEGGKYSMSWSTLLPSGMIERNATIVADRTTVKLWAMPNESCDEYNHCGQNELCESGGRCGCLPGPFKQAASRMGCERNRELSCKRVRFESVEKVKLPDTVNGYMEPEQNISECENVCRADCSCVAYVKVNLVKTQMAGCMRWSGDLSDLRVINNSAVHHQLFIKLSVLQPDKKGNKKVVAATVISSIVVILVVLCGGWLWRRKHSQPTKEAEIGLVQSIRSTENKSMHDDLFLYDYSTMALATRDFSEKIGQGGFGIVYKGIMKDGQVVAVKRLSNKISENATDEFLNEATLIARLQHRNLVRLLGCCTDGGESMLIYEYMCNKSLDTFIFDPKLQPMLKWKTRTNIILGISKGMLYLHEDSRLRVIHRDLKAANILLDEEMNPKISDFGTARIFMANQSEDKTMNVIGTLGYMSPEYAMDGTFSIKSDVFSFGVLMLEIISGIRNTKLTNVKICGREVIDKNLLALTWRLWKDGSYLNLLDGTITDSQPKEVQRYIQIALLCVQESADDRPTMSDVNSMLTNEEKNLSEPKRPGIYQGQVARNVQPHSSVSEPVGQMTITEIEGR